MKTAPLPLFSPLVVMASIVAVSAGIQLYSAKAFAAPRSDMVTVGYKVTCKQRQVLDHIAPHNRPLIVAAQSRGKVPSNTIARAQTAPCPVDRVS